MLSRAAGLGREAQGFRLNRGSFRIWGFSSEERVLKSQGSGPTRPAEERTCSVSPKKKKLAA